MVKVYFPWRVTWGKRKRYEDRFKTKEEAIKALVKLKKRKKKNGNDAYYNLRLNKINW